MLRRKKTVVTKDTRTDAVDAEAKESPWELVKTVLWALGIAFVLRTFIFQPFTIPSGSMYPNLVVGDYIITSKYSVGYGKYAAAPLPFPDVEGRLLGRGPERGDVIVFRPKGVRENYIKRVVGFPGDTIQMIDGVVHINGRPNTQVRLEPETYQHRRDRRIVEDVPVEVYQESLPGADTAHKIYDAQRNGAFDRTSVLTVPSGHYFVMGDNRDYSLDSRVKVSRGGAGYVPAENIIGRAEFILVSVNKDFYLFKPWTWANINGDRWFKRIE